MCTCYRNWQGNDCSERTCPYDYAFVTTPQGDLNMDGDRMDNSFKPLSQTVATLAALSNQVIFTAALAAGEIMAGDGIWIEGTSFIVAAHASATTSLTLDRVHETGVTGPVTAYRFLENIQRPHGTWESWPGDYGANDEGHFYMECSNRGLCDRKVGVCKCFAGYEGHACARSACPNGCSGHGTCDTVAELASHMPIAVGACTVMTTRGSTTLTTSADCSTAFAVGDHIMLGDHAAPLKLSAVSATALTLTNPAPAEYPYGTPVSKVANYKLWDANKQRACVCDSRYEGYDCSQLKCPKGDDPLTTGQTWETQTVQVGGSDPANVVGGSFKLKFQDVFGAKWMTGAIPVESGVDHSAEVQAALRGLPNDVIQDVSVTYLPVGSASEGARYHVTFDGGALPTANGNSGNLPLMSCDSSELTVLQTVATTATGIDVSAFSVSLTVDGSAAMSVTAAAGSTVITIDTALSAGFDALGDGDTILIGSELRVLTGNSGALAAGATSFKVDRAFSTALSAATPVKRAATQGTDYTKDVLFTGTFATTSEVAVGDLITLGTSTETRMVKSYTVSSGNIQSIELSAPFTTIGGVTAALMVARYVKGGVECTVTDQAAMMPSDTWTATPVTGSVGASGWDTAVTSSVTMSGLTVTLGAAIATATSDGGSIMIGTEIRVLRGNGGAIANTATSVMVDRPFVATTGTSFSVSTSVEDLSRKLTLDHTVDALGLAIGDRVLIKQASGSSAAEQTVTVSSVSTTTVNTVEPMDYHEASSALYNNGRGTRESVTCSRRGLCDSGTGLCKCFRGYTYDDCSRQNALAA